MDGNGRIVHIRLVHKRISDALAIFEQSVTWAQSSHASALQKVSGIRPRKSRKLRADCERVAMGREGNMVAKEFIADAALIVLVAWAMKDVLRQIRTKREQRKPRL